MDDDDDLLDIEKDILGDVDIHESQNLPPPNRSTTAIVTSHGTYLNGFTPAKSPFERVDTTTIEVVQPTIVQQDDVPLVQNKKRRTENYYSKDPPLSSPQRLISNTLTQTRSPLPPTPSQSIKHTNISQISPILPTSQSYTNTPISPHFQIVSTPPSMHSTQPPQQQYNQKQQSQSQKQYQPQLQQITLTQNISSTTAIQDNSNRIIPGPAGTLLNYNNNNSLSQSTDANQSISTTNSTNTTSSNDVSIANDINNSEMYLSSPLWSIIYKDLDITNNMSHYPIGVILKNDNTDTKIPELFGIITSITVKCTGTMISIKDTTGTIEGIIHKSLSDEINGQLSCGCIILLRNVSVLVTYLSNRYIIITKNNFVKLYIPNIQKSTNNINVNNTTIENEDDIDNDSNSLFGGMFRIPTQ